MIAAFKALTANKLYLVKQWKTDSSDPGGGGYTAAESAIDANLVSSELLGSDGLHSLVLDIDVPASLVPSSTFGHSHLYINAEMTWAAYTHLLDALVIAGIVEPGYRDASLARGFTAVRLPWIRK